MRHLWYVLFLLIIMLAGCGGEAPAAPSTAPLPSTPAESPAAQPPSTEPSPSAAPSAEPSPLPEPTAATQPPQATAGTAWQRQQFGDAWDIALPEGWTANTAGAGEGAVQLRGPYGEHTYEVTLAYPIGISASTLEAWVDEQLAYLTPQQRDAVEITDVTVAQAPAKKALNVFTTEGQKPTHNVYVWKADATNPRLIMVAQADDQPLDSAAMEQFLDQFIAEIK